jgi:ABC-2 type transport system permease protein
MLDIQRLKSMIRKEFLQNLRDPQTLRMILAAPILQLIVLGYAITNDPKDLRLGYLDLDRTQASREMVQSLENMGTFIVHPVASEKALVEDLDAGRSQVTLQIPPGFERRLARGETSPVQVLTDGSETNTATLALAYMAGTVGKYSGEVRAQWSERRGGSRAGINVSRQVWYNPALLSRNYILPGIVSLLITILASMLTVLSIAREREIGTLEQILVTPLTNWEFMVGKTAVPAMFSCAMAVPVILISVLWFRVPFRGSLLFLALAMVPFVLSSLGLGLLISTVSKTQRQAQMLNFFTNLPQTLLSGFIFPIATMPAWAQWVSSVIPQRYFLEIVRGVYLKGSGIQFLWPQVTALCVLSGLLFLAGARSFHRRLD